MRRITSLALTILFLQLATGCRRPSSVTSEIDRWENEGWEFHEAVGTRLEGAVYLSHEMSNTPRSFSAISTTDHGELRSKNYNMLKGGMLVVIMGREGQGCFSLVFTKY